MAVTSLLVMGTWVDFTHPKFFPTPHRGWGSPCLLQVPSMFHASALPPGGQPPELIGPGQSTVDFYFILLPNGTEEDDLHLPSSPTLSSTTGRNAPLQCGQESSAYATISVTAMSTFLESFHTTPKAETRYVIYNTHTRTVFSGGVWRHLKEWGEAGTSYEERC